MEDAALSGGNVVCTRWRLHERLGGRNARVWEAEDIQTHARVAIKFMPRPAPGDAGARRRFEREMRAICKVRSPHVVQIVDHGHTESGVPFVVTELLRGHDLGRLLGKERALGLGEAGRIVEQLCLALSKVHATGLVHRALTPENVFLVMQGDTRPTVKLLNLGFAAPELPKFQLADGSCEPFASPEWLDGARFDPRSDLWSLGVLAYRMLTGVWPFRPNQNATMRQQIRSATFIPVSVRRRQLPAELDLWFHHALQPDLERRFQTADEARAELERILRDFPEPSETRLKLDGPGANIVLRSPPSQPPRDSRVAWQVAGWSTVFIWLACYTFREPLAEAMCGRTVVHALPETVVLGNRPVLAAVQAEEPPVLAVAPRGPFAADDGPPVAPRDGAVKARQRARPNASARASASVGPGPGVDVGVQAQPRPRARVRATPLDERPHTLDVPELTPEPLPPMLGSDAAPTPSLDARNELRGSQPRGVWSREGWSRASLPRADEVAAQRPAERPHAFEPAAATPVRRPAPSQLRQATAVALFDAVPPRPGSSATTHVYRGF